MATPAPTDATGVPGPMAPVPFRVTRRRRELRDTWTLELEPVAGEPALSRARPVHDALRLRDRRGADLGLGRDERRRARPHRARGGRGHRGDLRGAAGRRARRARAVRELVAGRGCGRQRRRGRRRRHRARAAPARALRAAAPSRRVRRGDAPLRQPDARRPPLLEGAPTSARPLRPAGRRHGRQCRRRLARQGRRRAEARRRRALRSGVHRRARLRAGDHDALHGPRAPRARRRARADLPLDGAQHALRRRPLRPLPARTDADLPRRARVPLRRASVADGVREL